MVRIAINGFGRIGRVAFRIIEGRKRANKTQLQVVAVNDLTDLSTLAYLLQYDSVHGRFDGAVQTKDNQLVVNQISIQTFAERALEKLPWKSLGVDVVLEATGVFTERESAQKHLEAGAKKVLVSAPFGVSSPDATVCYGVNHQNIQKQTAIVSTASCTTNCIAPIAKTLHSHFGIQKASVTTIHSYTNDQHLLDLPHKDKRRSRAAAVSMIPTTTGAAKAVALVLPELAGKMDGMAIRVPTPNVSCIDMVALVEKNTTAQELNSVLQEASQTQFPGIMGFTMDPVVSVDMLGTTESSIVDGLCTRVTAGNLAKVIAWYDNEWGFTNRAVDLLEQLATFC